MPLLWQLFSESFTNLEVRVAPDMNYTIVINGAVWIGCMAYYFLFAKHWFTGPRMTVDENSSTESESTIINRVFDQSRLSKED